MANYLIHKTTSLPGVLEPNSVYFVAPTSGPSDYVEVYVTDSSGTAVRKGMDISRVQTLIDTAIAGSSGGLVVVDTIADRNAITATSAIEVLVLDATADPTVDNGWARYVWLVSSSSWFKMAEGESQDLTLTWDTITGKPTSTPALIDDAVNKRHTHTNLTQLNKINEDGQGNFLYNGVQPHIAWDTVNW